MKISVNNPPFVLMSYPRSGNTWTRYIIEFLTGRPTGSLSEKLALSDYSDIGADSEEPLIAVKVHRIIVELRSFPIRGLIFLMRNYKELVGPPVNGEPEDKITFVAEASIDQRMRDYLTLISYFHNFKGPKIIVYYEDLIQNPNKEIKRLSDFIGSNKYRQFMNSYDYHYDASFSGIYNNVSLQEKGMRGATKSRTKGKDLYYRLPRYDEDVKIKLDQKITELSKKYHKSVCDTYIERYRE